MNIMVLIELLDETLQEASSLPLKQKKLVDVDKCYDIIRDLRINLPEDIKDAEQIVADKDRILSDAEMEAQSIITEAEKRFQMILDDHEITRRAHDNADEIIARANADAQEIRLGAIGYADEMLNKMELHTRKALDDILRNRDDLNSL